MGTTGNADCDLSRRQFVQAAAAAGAGLALAQGVWGQTPTTAPATPLNIAIIGAGAQGRNLIINCLKIPGIRFKAVCDIWPYAQEYGVNILKKYKHEPVAYTEYQDMLAKEKGLDAVIVASPDWVHHEHSIACLKSGIHVYCEKEMSNTLEGAKAMVVAAREAKRLLQIGHQRRSNPRYHHALAMIYKENVLGRLTHCFGQWNRSRRLDNGWPEGRELPTDVLKKYGYDTMERFRNWRWYKQYAGGAMADLGSHQVDIFGWFLKARPVAVTAAGGLDYYRDREWYDNVMAIYDYKTEAGIVRAFYQVLNTTSWGGCYECFMGDGGSLELSEDGKRGLFFREIEAKRKTWEDESKTVNTLDREAIELKIGASLAKKGADPEVKKMMEQSQKPWHQVHLENFFDAVRSGSPLSCPADIGYETAVAILKANDAVAAGKKLEFKPEEFIA